MNENKLTPKKMIIEEQTVQVKKPLQYGIYTKECALGLDSFKFTLDERYIDYPDNLFTCRVVSKIEEHDKDLFNYGEIGEQELISKSELVRVNKTANFYCSNGGLIMQRITDKKNTKRIVFTINSRILSNGQYFRGIRTIEEISSYLQLYNIFIEDRILRSVSVYDIDVKLDYLTKSRVQQDDSSSVMKYNNLHNAHTKLLHRFISKEEKLVNIAYNDQLYTVDVKGKELRNYISDNVGNGTVQFRTRNTSTENYPYIKSYCKYHQIVTGYKGVKSHEIYRDKHVLGKNAGYIESYMRAISNDYKTKSIPLNSLQRLELTIGSGDRADQKRPISYRAFNEIAGYESSRKELPLYVLLNTINNEKSKIKDIMNTAIKTYTNISFFELSEDFEKSLDLQISLGGLEALREEFKGMKTSEKKELAYLHSSVFLKELELSSYDVDSTSMTLKTYLGRLITQQQEMLKMELPKRTYQDTKVRMTKIHLFLLRFIDQYEVSKSDNEFSSLSETKKRLFVESNFNLSSL